MNLSSKVMTRLTQLIQPILAELRNGRINVWMAKGVEKSHRYQ